MLHLLPLKYRFKKTPNPTTTGTNTASTMALDLSALSRMQIQVFFERNRCVTQKQCNDKAQEITGDIVTPTVCQGGTSYTVYASGRIVQFRGPGSFLDMDLMGGIEQAYPGFAPWHKDCGPFHNLRVYTMNNMGGDSADKTYTWEASSKFSSFRGRPRPGNIALWERFVKSQVQTRNETAANALQKDCGFLRMPEGIGETELR